MAKLILKEEVYAIIGAAMEVHSELGCGFLEPVYQEALEIEFKRRSIPFTAQQELAVFYKGLPLRKKYCADFITFEKIIVEIKAVTEMSSREEAQILNYLRATGLEVGVLLNFGAERLQYKRKILTPIH